MFALGRKIRKEGRRKQRKEWAQLTKIIQEKPPLNLGLIQSIINSSTNSWNTCLLSAQKVPGTDLRIGYEQNAPASDTNMQERETLSKYRHHGPGAGNQRCEEGDGGRRCCFRWVARGSSLSGDALSRELKDMRERGATGEKCFLGRGRSSAWECAWEGEESRPRQVTVPVEFRKTQRRNRVAVYSRKHLPPLSTVM